VTDARAETGIAAFESVFDECSTAFYRFFAVRTRDRHHADDLMQQLWMQARPRGVSITAGEIEFWLRSVARNLLATFWRKRLRRGVAQAADSQVASELARRLATEELPTAELERREYRELLLLAITELSAAEQELILGCYYEGLSHAALAARLGVSERAIEGRLYRARQTLREKLQSLE
jgi:RNA polymerase sigma-70 factor (ECF subfamily)